MTVAFAHYAKIAFAIKTEKEKSTKKGVLIVFGTLLFGITATLPVVLFIVSYLFSKSSRPDMPTKKRIITTLIYTVCLSAALYLIYVVALDVRLKPGILFK